MAAGEGLCSGHRNPGAGVGRVDLEGPEIDGARPFRPDGGGKGEDKGDEKGRKKTEGVS